MNNLNSILLEGNLTSDPDLRETPKGTSVCNLRVASNRYSKRNDEVHQEVSFFDVEVWAHNAENCAKYLQKGRGVRVVGRLKQDRWDDGEGKSKSRVKVVAEHVEFKPAFTGPGKKEPELVEAAAEEPENIEKTEAELVQEVV